MLLVCQLELLVDDAGQDRKMRLRSDVGLDARPRAIEQLSSEGHEPGGERVAADVDPEDHVTTLVAPAVLGIGHGEPEVKECRRPMHVELRSR